VAVLAEPVGSPGDRVPLSTMCRLHRIGSERAWHGFSYPRPLVVA